MQPIVEFQNICKEYPGVVANNNVSFEITRQSIHAILGENGAGKSTLVKILYGHVKPDKGQIIINSDLATIKDFISKNYNEILKKELKFSKKYWSNHENSSIETISSIWVEIFEDDQHIKSLEIEINNFDKNIKDDNNEKRLISILEKKDFELKKITEKYGQ